jgi:hypothetical protein
MTPVDSPISLPLRGLRFKGERQYLQGPDIFVAALNALTIDLNTGPLTDIDIVFHRMARTGLTLVSPLPFGAEPAVQLSCRVAGVRKKHFLIEDGREILDRYDYAEEKIVEATKIQVTAASATSAIAMPFTDIERWIAMVKALHYALYPEVNGKWLFVRGKFDSYPGTYRLAEIDQQVRVESNFNNKLTRSALLVGGAKLGDIFFSLD